MLSADTDDFKVTDTPALTSTHSKQLPHVLLLTLLGKYPGRKNGHLLAHFSTLENEQNQIISVSTQHTRMHNALWTQPSSAVSNSRTSAALAPNCLPSLVQFCETYSLPCWPRLPRKQRHTHLSQHHSYVVVVLCILICLRTNKETFCYMLTSLCNGWLRNITVMISQWISEGAFVCICQPCDQLTTCTLPSPIGISSSTLWSSWRLKFRNPMNEWIIFLFVPKVFWMFHYILL